jgi:protein O-mannosyl-transferase
VRTQAAVAQRRTRAPAGGPSQGRLVRALLVLGVALVGALAFAAVLPGARFVFDDHVLIEKNSDLHRNDVWWMSFERDYYTSSAQVGRSGYYRPVAVLTHAADLHVWGKHRWGYHLTNLVLHALACAALVPALGVFGASFGTALLVALLFAVHPSHAESVAFVSGRVDVLAGLGIFIALAFAGRRRRGASVGLGLAALFAFLSKEIAVVLPVLLVIAWAAGRRTDDDEAEAGLSGGAIAVATATAVIMALLMRYAALGQLLPTTAHAPRPAGAVWLPFQALGFAIASLYTPVKKLLLEPQPGQLSALRLAVGVIVGAAVWIGAWRADRDARPFLRRCAWAGAIALLPVLDILPQETQISERYLYVASAFWLAPIAVLVRAGWRRGGFWQPLCAGSFALVAVLFLGISTWRARAWRDDRVLWSIAVEEEPNRVAFWDRLGLTLTERHEFAPAEEALRRAVALDPNYFNAQVNLGVLLQMTRRHEEAIAAYRKALEIDPKHVNTHLNIGLSLMDLHQMPQAYEEFKTAVALKPDNPDALRLAGAAAITLGKLDEARRYLEAARRILPQHPAIQEAFRVLEEAEHKRAGQ